MKSIGIAMAFAAACFCAQAAGVFVDPELKPARAAAVLKSRTDAAGTTTYWGDGASYDIAGPGVTVFFLRRDDGAVVAPMIRVAYVGEQWINAESVTFTVGERTYGPYADVYSKPTRLAAGASLMVEALLFNVDSDDKWRMLDAIAEADDLGRPVIAVLDGESPYGIELDRATKRATGQLVRGFREATRAR